MSTLEERKAEEAAEKKADDDAIAEFLKNGGKITKCPKFERTEGVVSNVWKKSNKKNRKPPKKVK